MNTYQFQLQKWILVGLFISLLASVSFAQTLHMFVVTNTNGQGVGSSCKVDYQNVTQEAEEIARLTNLRLAKYYHYASQSISPSTLIRQVNNLRCAPNDVVWFHYSGHGKNYPGSYFSSFRIGDTKFGLEKLHKRIKSKGPRLAITTFDACNFGGRLQNGNFISQRDDPQRSRLNYIKLFKKSRGDIMVSSNTAGLRNYSYGSPDTGGFFTRSFIDALHTVTNGDSRICTWQNLLRQAQQQTKGMARRAGYNQVPYYQSRINSTQPNVNAAPDHGKAKKDAFGDN